MDLPEVLVGEGVELCGRCATELHEDDRVELCIVCEGPLCGDCWEVPGNCGRHAEWELAMRALQLTSSHEERARIMASPGPIGQTRAARFRFN